MFSVVIPVFNHEQFLTECVLSAAANPLVREVFLLDDGSTDGSYALVKRLSGGALGKVRDVTPVNRVNRGAHVCLNDLVEQARCEWIAVLNSDDVFTASRFEVIARRLRGEPVDMLFGNVLVIDEAGRQLGGKRAMFDPQIPFPRSFDVAAMVGAGEWPDLLSQQNFLATTSNIVFRKSLFGKIGGFAEYRYVHDWDFCLRAALKGRVAYVPQALTAYRVHSSNTIKESGGKVDAEVRRMFARLLEDFPELKDREKFREGMAANPYLRDSVQPLLSLVLPAEAGAEIYAAAVRRHVDVEVTQGEPRGLYRYAPESVLDALHPLHLQNAALALSVQDLDFVLVSHTLAAPPAVGTKGLRNNMVSRHSQEHVSGGHVARLFPGGGSVKVLEGMNYTGQSARETTLPSGILSGQDAGALPLIFVLPALFAVGGVERLVIDMMRQLGNLYAFVVITVEQLNERLGSLHGPAEGAVLGFYDLAELATPPLFLTMMEQLRAVYWPALVWIPNGSPWQCDNAAGIRRVFSSIPIVDQQVYDTAAGWIARYHEPGIRSYDRFIAINRKIEDTFVNKYGIARDRIDMIYHSVNLNALGPAARSEEERSGYRARYGIPQGKQVFGWVGRLTVQKRPLQFLEFALAASAADVNRHFVMIGDGELAGECEAFVERNRLTSITRVRFSNRMGELFSLIDGLLSTSKYEGLPISMLEALAMGVPVFSTDVGDVGLVLAEYQAGAVTAADWDGARYSNDFEQWAKELKTWRENARAAAPRVRERFGSEAVAAQYNQCFERAIQEGSSQW